MAVPIKYDPRGASKKDLRVGRIVRYDSPYSDQQRVVKVRVMNDSHLFTLEHPEFFSQIEIINCKDQDVVDYEESIGFLIKTDNCGYVASNRHLTLLDPLDEIVSS